MAADDRISDPRSVRKKYWAQLAKPIVRELDGFARWQKLDVDLAATHECVRSVASLKGQHPSIGRERRGSCRVREMCDLFILNGTWMDRFRSPEDRCCGGQRDQYRDRRPKPVM